MVSRLRVHEELNGFAMAHLKYLLRLCSATVAQACRLGLRLESAPASFPAAEAQCATLIVACQRSPLACSQDERQHFVPQQQLAPECSPLAPGPGYRAYLALLTPGSLQLAARQVVHRLAICSRLGPAFLQARVAAWYGPRLLFCCREAGPDDSSTPAL